MKPAKHTLLATLDLGDDWFVGVCECGWASPNVRARYRASEAVRVHALLREDDEALKRGSRPAA